MYPNIFLRIFDSLFMRDVCIFVFCLLLLTLPGFGIKVICNSVQLLSRCVRHFVTLWTAAHQASWSITNSQNLLKLTSIESVMASNHLILCGPLLFLPSVFSSIRVFSSESAVCINQVATVLGLQLQHQSNEYSGLIPFRIE